jgi:hypothetical protein
MKLKTVGMAFLALVVLGAVMASSAFATPVTKKSRWQVGTTPITTPQAVTCSKAGSENLILKGSVLGAATELKATGIECVEATISNEVVGGENMAVDAGKLKFTGVSVVQPAGCGVAETLTTEPLVTTLFMDSSSSTVTYDKFAPKGEKFISIKITGCSIAGTYPVKGFTYGEAANPTGTLAANQPLKFNSTTNSFGTLTLGTEPASITGEANNALVSGQEFRAVEE